MTRETAQKMSEILKAYANGATVQYLVERDKWEDFDEEPSFTGNLAHYRIKPREPREFTIFKHEGGYLRVTEGTMSLENGEQVRVREILNDETP